MPTTLRQLARRLGDSDADTGDLREMFGGKAMGLARAMAAGIDVPPGLCIPTAWFDSALERLTSRLVEDIEDVRRCLRQLEPHTRHIDALTTSLNSLAEQWPFGGDIRWAVRSSAVCEDAATRSFAGQFHSQLDVEDTPTNVWQALCEVWVGTFDTELVSYISRIRVDADPIRMAVLIQPMVDGGKGGVIFTEDPRGRPSTTGDFEPVATIASSPSDVVDGEEGTTVRLTADGPVPADPSTQTEYTEDIAGDVSEDLARRLRTLASLLSDAGVMRHDDRGADIEWSMGPDDTMWLLQSRPVTRRAGDADTDGAPSVWSNANVGEALPGVATPLTWSIIGSFSRRGFEQAFGAMGLDVPQGADLVGSFRGRVYLNLTEFVDIASGLPFLDASILYQMAGGGGVDLLEEQIDEVPSAAFMANLPATLPKIVGSQLSMPAIASVWMRYFDLQVDRHFELDLDALEADDLLAELDDIDALFDRNGRIMLSAGSNFLISYVAMRLFARWFAGESLDEQALIAALDVSSAEPGIELLEMARDVRQHPELLERLRETPPDGITDRLRRLTHGRDNNGAFVSDETRRAAESVLEALSEFRRRFGHRAPGEAELSTPRWREDDTFVWRVLLGYLQADSLPDRQSLQARHDLQRNQLAQQIRDVFPVGLKGLFEYLWRWTRRAARIREALRDRVVESLDLYRSIALEVGRRMHRRGILPRRQDVFYLRHDELVDYLEAGGSSRSRASQPPLRVRAIVRRHICQTLRDLPDPPNTFVRVGNDLVDEETYRNRSRGSSRRATRADADACTVIEGLTAHGGCVEGRARVVTDPSEATLEPGEILVAPRTDVGWTPLFLTASAVVMELGGPLSHAAIVAREYDLPTVVNAEGIIDAVETGDLLVVDATNGRIEIHARDEDDETTQPNRA